MSSDLTLTSGSPFDSIRRVREDGSEYWDARELQPLLGYLRWEDFRNAVERARSAIGNAGLDPQFHASAGSEAFGPTRQMGANYHLTRYGAYMAAMNGDPRKREIADAQTYFAVKTREAEVAQRFEIPQNFAEALELAARKVREIEALEQRNAELAPLAAAEEHHRSAHGLKAVGDFANDLKAWAKTNHPAVKVKHQDVWDHLARLDMVIRGNTVRHNQPTAKAIDQGWCVPKVSDFDTSEGARSSTTTRLTPKGEGYAWDRITSYVEANGTLELPRRIGEAS